MPPSDADDKKEEAVLDVDAANARLSLGTLAVWSRALPDDEEVGITGTEGPLPVGAELFLLGASPPVSGS